MKSLAARIRENGAAAIRGPGLRAQLMRGGIGSVVIKACGMILSVGVAIALGRVLGPENYGIYAYVIALISLLSIPAQFGLPALVVRETAKAQVNNNYGLMRGAWRLATLAGISLSVLLGATSLVVLWIFLDFFPTRQVEAFLWGVLLVPLLTVGNLRGAALRGLGNVVQGQLPEAVIRPALLLFFVTSSAYIWPNAILSSADAMSLHVLAAVAAFCIGATLLWNARPQGMRIKPRPTYRTREWLASALPLSLTAAMQVINQHADILVLGVFAPAEDVGTYRVSFQAATLVSFGLTALGMVTWPHFVRLHQKGDMIAFQKIATYSARVMLAFAVPVGFVFIFFGEWVLKLAFGEVYVGAYPPLIILTCAHIVHAGFGSVGPLLNMTGHEKITAWGVTIAAAANVLLNLSLIPFFGQVGAAIGTSLSLIVWNLVLWLAVKRVLNINSAAFKFHRHHSSRDLF